MNVDHGFGSVSDIITRRLRLLHLGAFTSLVLVWHASFRGPKSSLVGSFGELTNKGLQYMSWFVVGGVTAQ